MFDKLFHRILCFMSLSFVEAWMLPQWEVCFAIVDLLELLNYSFVRVFDFGSLCCVFKFGCCPGVSVVTSDVLGAVTLHRSEMMAS